MKGAISREIDITFDAMRRSIETVPRYQKPELRPAKKGKVKRGI